MGFIGGKKIAETVLSLIISPASFPASKGPTEWAHLWALLFENMPTFPTRDADKSVKWNSITQWSIYHSAYNPKQRKKCHSMKKYPTITLSTLHRVSNINIVTMNNVNNSECKACTEHLG